MRLLRRRSRPRVQLDWEGHRAALESAETRLQAARALARELESWPSPLACWLALQAGRWPYPPIVRRARIDLDARGLPVVVHV